MSHPYWLHKLIVKATAPGRVEALPVFPSALCGESLDAAHAYCSKLTAIHSKSFHMASGLLTEEKRKGIRALYAFCRTSDDIVDRPTSHFEGAPEQWRLRSLTHIPQANDPVSIAWAHTRLKFNIPVEYAHQLIDGVAMDLSRQRYMTFEELSDYCYGVASTVGLMSMHIVGFKHKEAIHHAIQLGVALQLINILRDIHEDYLLGRVYLPQEEMKAFHVSETHIREGILDKNWQSFMRFQIDRVNHLYKESWKGIALLHPSGRLAVSAALVFYRGILSKIEESGYDVFRKRAVVSQWGKLKMIPKLILENSFQSTNTYQYSK